MTTFLLHGGVTSSNSPNNDIFFGQFTSLVKKTEVKILLCYWATNQEKWEELVLRDTARILKNTNKKVEFYVVKNPKDLFDKIDDFDVLYIAGGKAKYIESLYKELSSLKEKLKGKIYAGSSMGAFLASEQYVISFNGEDSSAHKGLGLLPIQTLCHWDIESKKEKKIKLLSTSSSAPIIILNESEVVTFMISRPSKVRLPEVMVESK